MSQQDVVIVGGGIVGCVLAKGLSEQAGLSVTLVDAANPLNAASSSNSTSSADTADSSKVSRSSKAITTFNPLTDTRVIALARRTVNELSAMGVGLAELAKQNQGKIEHIEVSDKGGIGLTNLSCSEFGINTFGQVVSLSALTHNVMSQSKQYQHIAPATVTHLTRKTDTTVVTLNNGSSINAKLLVIADGGRSSLAQQVGLTRHTDDYQQVAIIFNAHTSEPHHNKAYERFTKNGPVAFLPFDSEISGQVAKGKGFSVVWTVAKERAESLMQLSPGAFIHRLQQEFGYRQGRITAISEIGSYPLALSYTDALTTHRAVVVGNAAQALHPIAGQGFNLGLRDIITLVDTLKGVTDPGEFNVLNEYTAKRSKDRAATITLTDTLVRTFSNRYFPLVAARNLALTALNVMPSAKRAFVQQTTGYGRRV